MHRACSARSTRPARGRQLLIGVLAACLASIATPRTSSATTVVPIRIEDLATRADDVVVGTVRVSHSSWLGRTIVTDHEVEVQSVVRGALTARANIVVRLPGGTVGRITQVVPGVSQPATGVPYVWFLSRAANVPSVWYVAHLTASILRMTTDPAGVVRVLPAGEGMITASAPATMTTSSAAVTNGASASATTPTNASAGSVPSAPTQMTNHGIELEALVRALRDRP